MNGTAALAVEDSLEELAALSRTAGLEVVGATYQRLERPHPATLIGSGKLGELQTYRDELDIDVFLFDDELSPRQQRELEKALAVKVIDRTALILDVFAQHAHTREGQLQVELAQLNYRLPRLTRMWTHLARQAGGRAGGATGGVGVRGPGETQLEVDRREINRKIARLRRELENVRAHRARHRAQRQRAGIPVVAIVGYTNAGKSTLLNQLTQMTGAGQGSAGVYVADQLFATLDPTTRRVRLANGLEVLFSDTVGFIQKLPTQLVAAFRATLEEIGQADILLHVIDISHPNALEQSAAVEITLRQIEATTVPIVVALNKIDRLPNAEDASMLVARFPNSLAISAATGQGLDRLLTRIEGILDAALVPLAVHIPYPQAELVALFHRQGTVDDEQHDEHGTFLRGRVPARLARTFAPFATEEHIQETRG
ncbi:MAG: GTPase HflX [Anaerolineae bacterium]